MNAEEIISGAPVFSGLNAECMSSLIQLARVRKKSEGEVIFNKGERADGLYVLGLGEIEMFCATGDGKEQIMHVLTEGDLCAEVPLFQGGVYPASARAYTDIEYCYIEGGAFLDFACENPEVLLEMLAVISLRTKKFLSMVESLSLQDVTQRLAGYLLSNADSDGIVRLNRSKIELAAQLGTIPETLSRSLKKLATQGAIAVCSSDKKSYQIAREVISEIVS